MNGFIKICKLKELHCKRRQLSLSTTSMYRYGLLYTRSILYYSRITYVYMTKVCAEYQCGDLSYRSMLVTTIMCVVY